MISTKVLFENNQLPNHVRSNLTNQQYNGIYQWISNDPNFHQKNLRFIKRYNLVPIHEYRNGDSAWYSLKNDHVYAFNHELGTFNDIAEKEVDLSMSPGIWLAMPYQKWKRSRKIDAWEKQEEQCFMLQLVSYLFFLLLDL